LLSICNSFPLMIVYSLLAITLFISFLSIYILWRSRNNYQLLLAAVLAVFIYLYGAWVFLSVYGKYIFGAFFAILFVIAISRRRHEMTVKPNPITLFLQVLLILAFSALSILYFTGTTGAPPGVARLSLPFKRGNYFVFQGGKGLPTNVFHTGLRGAVYAMDIVKLNRAGNRATHIFSTRLGDYEIYGDTIYSPCNGIISAAVSDNKDNTPPQLVEGPHHAN
jgi:hypothetical protein